MAALKPAPENHNRRPDWPPFHGVPLRGRIEASRRRSGWPTSMPTLSTEFPSVAALKLNRRAAILRLLEQGPHTIAEISDELPFHGVPLRGRIEAAGSSRTLGAARQLSTEFPSVAALKHRMLNGR